MKNMYNCDTPTLGYMLIKTESEMTKLYPKEYSRNTVTLIEEPSLEDTRLKQNPCVTIQGQT